jgi:D-lactate dehydrogenase
VAGWIGEKAADHMAAVTAMGRAALSAGAVAKHVLGEDVIKKGMGKLSGRSADQAVQYASHLPLPAPKAKGIPTLLPGNGTTEAVYFSSCITRTLGRDAQNGNENTGQEDLIPLVLRLCHRAGINIRWPKNRDSLCCGLAFASKGHAKAARRCQRRLAKALLDVSCGGKLPILCDASSCLAHMRETLPKTLTLYEPAEFTTRFLAPYLNFKRRKETVMLHVNCSIKTMGLEKVLVRLAEKCADRVIVTNANCCGFAGDRGFLQPQLKHHGLRRIAGQKTTQVVRGFSTNRTCEIGLADESGIPFQSILYLVEECTRL